MAAARINVPTVFVSGGPMLAGHVKGQKRSLSSMFEAVGSYAAGKMTEEDVREFEEKVCPTCGSCSGMYTANSMNCLTEALGMGLQGNGTIPAVYSERIKLAKHAGMAVMEMLRKNIRPRDIMTKEAILNALTVDMALGCSTNSMLHLPAIAHEVGFDFVCLTGNPGTGVTNEQIEKAISFTKENFSGLIIAGKMHGAGSDEPVADLEIAKRFVKAGADVILVPAVGTVPGFDMDDLKAVCKEVHSCGGLVLSAIGTSQEGSDTDTIKDIAIMNKICGVDIQHIGDAGYGGVAPVENIMTISKAVRGVRHTVSMMARSINR